MSVNRSGLSDQEFIDLFKRCGAAECARLSGVSERSVHYRRKRIEKAHSIVVNSPNKKNSYSVNYPKRLPIQIRDGVVIIGSDAHYWPGIVSTAHRALIHIAKKTDDLQAVILNGDVKDGASNSRHPAMNFGYKPKVKEEIDAVYERLNEIEAVSKNNYWILGNHCMRYEAKLAQMVPEYDGVAGMTLKDHFPKWNFALSIWINDAAVVKHRFKGGIHATHNNAMWSGKSIFTGHLHSLKVTPFDDYNGTRWGGDTGTLADPYGPQFEYAEDNPLNHRSGFLFLTFRDGKLLWPEIVRVVKEGVVDFRGELISV